MALLDQAFAHCPIFLTAALHGSLGLVSVPVWLIILLRPTKDHRLGSPLHYQLPNLIKALHIAIYNLFNSTKMYSYLYGIYTGNLLCRTILQFFYITHPYAT